MNQEIQDFARQQIKEGLATCTEGQQTMFKRMYSHGNLDKDINAVVDDMPSDKLDWALTQVQRTVRRNKFESGELK